MRKRLNLICKLLAVCLMCGCTPDGRPGNSGHAPGHDANGPGNSKNAPGHNKNKQVPPGQAKKQ